MESGLRGPDGNVEGLRHIARPEAEVVREDEDRALRLAEAPEPAFELVPIGELCRSVVFDWLARDHRELGAPAATLASDVRARADVEPVDPGVEAAHIAQRWKIAPRPHERLALHLPRVRRRGG